MPDRARDEPVLLRLDGISKTYQDGTAEVRALHEVDLKLQRGEMTSLVGVSGSGKTTLLSLIAGLLLPESGRILFEDRDLTSLSDTARAQVRSNHIGMVLQRSNLIPFLTARENVELVTTLSPDGGSGTGPVELLQRLGLGNRLDHRPGGLSGGEAQRVAVAVALANDPDLLLADEATGELDEASAQQVMELLFAKCLDEHLTVLYVTHNARLAARAEKQLMLINGQLVAS